MKLCVNNCLHTPSIWYIYIMINKQTIGENKMETLETLKYETVAEVGDVIKAYDFEPLGDGRDDYTVGLVEEKGVHPKTGYGCYIIKTIFSVRRGEIKSGDKIRYKKLYVPFQTTFDYENRVTKI